jgi:hypothetical protein
MIKNVQPNILTGKKVMMCFPMLIHKIDKVCKYVINHESHHKRKTFKEEYYELLQKFAVPFEEKYLFEWID